MKIVPSLFVCALSITSAFSNDFPKFQVDASWPKPLPNNWIMGQAAGVAVDAQDNVWVIQRPRTLTDDEKAASFTPPRTKCCVPAPPVMQFDSDGNLLKEWDRKEWRDMEPRIAAIFTDFMKRNEGRV